MSKKDIINEPYELKDEEIEILEPEEEADDSLCGADESFEESEANIEEIEEPDEDEDELGAGTDVDEEDDTAGGEDEEGIELDEDETEEDGTEEE